MPIVNRILYLIAFILSIPFMCIFSIIFLLEIILAIPYWVITGENFLNTKYMENAGIAGIYYKFFGKIKNKLLNYG